MNDPAIVRTVGTMLDAHDVATVEQLVERITALLATDPERLMSILYRLDVSEDRIGEIFRRTPLDRIAAAIAQAMIERIAEKLATRQRYARSRQFDVRLRSYTPDDAEQLYDAVIESFEELSRWLAWCRKGYSLADAQAWCQWAAESFAAGEAYHFVAEALRVESIEFAGGCSLTPTTDRANNVVQLGYWTRSTLAGCGVATKAASAAVAFAFDRLAAERVEILIATGNKASQRVAEKIGAQREGVMRSRLAVGDRRHDAFVYGILRSQWIERRNSEHRAP